MMTQDVYQIAEGTKGVKQTLWMMKELVDRAIAEHSIIWLTAYKIVENVRDKDYIGEAKAVYNWVKRNIRYTRDPAGKEMLKEPRWVLKYKHGDCDDHAMLVAALLGVLGHEVRFTVVQVQEDSSTYDHVFAEVLDERNNQWISLDTTNKKGAFGWRVRGVKEASVKVTTLGRY